jgi:iron complex outermembrane receptor protein
MRPLTAATLLGVAAIACTSAHAADNERLDTLTVTVTADTAEDNLPLAISTVNAESQPAANEQSLQDWLEPVPGLYAQNQDNAAQGLRVAIRGFGTRAAFGLRGIRVLVDSVPMTLPDGQTELDALDLALLESAQVIRGPSATLFGNAAGGAILLNTRRPGTEPALRLDTQIGSFGNHRSRLEASGRINQTGLLASYLTTETDGYREHAATESDLLNALLEQPLGEGRFTASVSSLNITAQDPGGITAAQAKANRRSARAQNIQFNGGEHIEQQRLALGWDGALGAWALQTTAYAGQRDFDNRLPFTNGGQVEFERAFGGFGITSSRRFDRHRLSSGIDLQIQNDARQRFDNNDGQRGNLTLNQDEEAQSFGIFLRDSIALSNAWETSLGIRYDSLHLSNDDNFLADGDDSGQRDIDDWSYDLSLTHWRGTAMFYARIASAFETPSITELANPNGGGFNDALESSQAHNYELGVKNRWQALRYTATIYYIDVEDELLPYELASQPGRSFFRNAGETQRQGLELSGELPLGPHWQLDAAYNYATNRFEGGALDGNELPGIPEQTAWLALRYSRDSWSLAATGNYIGELFADDANQTAVDAYQLLNLQAAWQINQYLQISSGIDNLFDKEHNDNIRINAFGGRYFEPASGRNYRASLRIQL